MEQQLNETVANFGLRNPVVEVVFFVVNVFGAEKHVNDQTGKARTVIVTRSL